MVARAIFSTLESMEGRTMFSFSTPVTYAGGAGPVAMITADLNGDGRADLISSNSGGSVTALLGNGDATFQAPKSSTLALNVPGSHFTGSQAGTLTSGDFNGDGKVDVATVSGNNVIILLGNGDGTFQAPLSSYAGTSPTRISTGDVNGDGHIDVVVANTAGSVSVLLGHGDGTFAPAVSYLAGPSPQDVKAVDLNHDGKLDLVVANAISAGSVSVLIGRGDGTFLPYISYAAFSAPYRMDVIDLNGDGNPDVVVANSYTSSSVTVLLGNPDGTFQPYHSYDTGAQPWELHAVDINGDGKPDLVSSNGSTYQLQLNNGDGTFGVSQTIAGAGFAFAAGDFNGDGVADIAGANLSNVGVLVNNAAAITNVGAAVGFQLTAPANIPAGDSLPLTLTAIDANGAPATDFLGVVHLITTDPRMGGITYQFTAADAGTHTFSGISLYTMGLQTIIANGPAQLTGSTSVNVIGASAKQFTIRADAKVVAGKKASFTVTAQDAFGNLTNAYTGTVHFSSSDVQAGLPSEYTFTSADQGVHQFSATLKIAGYRTITANDTSTATMLGTSNPILVTPTAAAWFKVVGGGGHIGSAHTLTVTAVDSYGNVATGYNGVIHIESSDRRTILAADGALIKGVGTFAVTPVTLGAQTLRVMDTYTRTMFGSESIVGTPGDATRFVVGALPGGVAGSTQNLSVTAYDSYGNIAVDYSGTIVAISTDLRATLPYYTFTSADAGTHKFSVVMRTAGTQSLTIRDIAKTAITATQSGIKITPAAPSSISNTPINGSVAGVNQGFTVTARDAYGNIASGYRGTIRFTTTDALATIPSTYAFTAADGGTHAFAFAFQTSGGQTFAIQDTVNITWSTFQRDIPVTPAAMVGFAFRTPSSATAGAAFNVTLAAVDAFGNTVTNYRGKVHFPGPTGDGSVIPADYTFNSLDAGSHIFSINLATAGTQIVSVQDSLNGLLNSQFSIVVKAATGGGGTGGGGKQVV